MGDGRWATRIWEGFGVRARRKSGRGLPQSRTLARRRSDPRFRVRLCRRRAELPRVGVSPGSAGLRRGVLSAPGFGHDELLGDTLYVFCVMW